MPPADEVPAELLAWDSDFWGIRIARRRIQEIAEVVAGSEILALAAEGDQTDGFVVVGALDRLGQRLVHGDGDRVLGSRAANVSHQ